MLIKVCGMRDDKNISELLELQPDYMGMIFFSKSPRFVGTQASNVQKERYAHTQKVGVFVNEDDKFIWDMINEFGLDMIQLHGHETPEQCERFHKEIPVIKAFSIANDEDLTKTAIYEGTADLFLFDTKTPGYGGSGLKFDWSLIKEAKIGTDFLLSGGIGEDDIDLVKSLQIPKMIGIDLNSKFEVSPAFKDIAKLRNTFIKIRE